MSSQDSIVFRIARTEPIELEQLTFGMLALGAEYERFIKSSHPQAKEQEADLLVHKISEGSILIELFGAMQPILQGMNNILIFKQFVELLGNKLSILESKDGRLEKCTSNELKDLSNLVSTVAENKNGKAELIAYEYNSKTKSREVKATVVLRSKSAEVINKNITEQLIEMAEEKTNRQQGVLMRLYQTNIGDAATDRASGEKGIIESISDNPKRLVYASDLAGQKIKGAWTEDGISPYELGFIVDVDIQTINGKPRAYRIMEVYDIFPLDENED